MVPLPAVPRPTVPGRPLPVPESLGDGDRPRVDVVGLGPAGADLVTASTLGRLQGPDPVRLRTVRHPAVAELGVLAGVGSFDHVYDEAATLDDVYPRIVAELVAEAERAGGVVYAVPGSPVVAERTVELLVEDPRLEVRLWPALSFLDLAWVRLGVDPVRSGVHVVDGHRFATATAGSTGPFLVAQCDDRSVLSDVKLSVEDPPDVEVVVLHHLGLADELVRRVHWDDLDRGVDADHLTSLYVPALAEPLGSGLDGFTRMVTELRHLDPWKAEQTHRSLSRYLREETAELLEAIERYDPDTGAGSEELCAELGDVLYQVVFHAVLAEEAGWFTLGDVIGAIDAKLRWRHPELEDPTAVVHDPVEAQRRWQERKLLERTRGDGGDTDPSGSGGGAGA